MLSPKDIKKLRDSGFILYEIDKLDKAVDPAGVPQSTDLTSPAWQATIEHRHNWVRNMQARIVQMLTMQGKETTPEMSFERIRKMIFDYYKRDKTRSPFDFLKVEYEPKKRVDYHEALRKRKAEDINRSMKGYYR